MRKFFSINEIKSHAFSLGFDSIGVTDISLLGDNSTILKEFIENQYHASMDWIEETQKRRSHPLKLWENARSAIMLGVNYAPGENPLHKLAQKTYGNVSVYALGEDYHIFIKKNLKKLARIIAQKTGKPVKLFVDTAPLMEKPIAQNAGLGWQGKHTNLVSRNFGSWLFLGAILTQEKIDADSKPERDHCGTCTSCLDICPTQAFPKPYMIDARRCISYLTIEHKGHIDRAFRKPMGNRIFGCDDCLAVCPWNKFARRTHHIKLAPIPEMQNPKLENLAALDEEEFRVLFRRSPIKRTGRARFIRNVMIAIGNSQNPSLAKSAIDHLESSSVLIRAMAIWALSQLIPQKDFISLRKHYMKTETDKDVIQEWKEGALLI